MSGWAQREAERKEDEANEMDELITEVRELHTKLLAITTERDTLRAELAAAKEEADRSGFHLADAKGEIAVLSRKLEDCQATNASHEVANKHYYEKLQKALADGIALAAHVERLEKALKMWLTNPFILAPFGDHGDLAALSQVYYHNSMSVTKAALAATPAQSLAAHDAALLREVAVKWYRSGPSNAAVLLEDEADRIEQEGADG